MGGRHIIISLSDEDRTRLIQIVSDQNENPRAVLRAQILIMSDEKANMINSSVDIGKKLNTTHTTVQTTRHDYILGGIDAAVFRKKRTIYPTTCKITAAVKQQILALYNENPPDQKTKWSLSQLCKVCEERGIINKISTTSVMKILRETEMIRPNDNEE